MKKITLLISLLVTAICAAQFPENFDTGAFPPAGWTSFIGTNGAGTNSNWTTLGTSPNRNAFVDFENSGQVNEDWLVTPLISISSTQNRLEFSQTNRFEIDYGTSYTIRVSTTSQTDHSTFTVIDTQNETEVRNGDEFLTLHTVDLDAYNGQSIYIAFVMTQNDGDAWIIDDVELSAIPSCEPAQNLTFDAFTTTTADISWDNAGDYTIEWGEFPYTQGSITGNSTVVNGNSYQFTNLTPGVSYGVFIRQDCGAVNGNSEIEEITVGTTIDPAISFPYNEDFEIAANQSLFINIGVRLFNDTGAFEFGRDDTNDGDTSNDFAFNGTDYFSSNSTFTDADSDATIYVGPYTLDSGFEYTFSVQQRNLVVSTATVPSKDIELIAATSPDGTTNTVLATFDDMDNITYTLRSGNFIPPSTGDYYFGVRDKTDILTGVTAGNRVFIDDVNISSVPLSVSDISNEVSFFYNQGNDSINIESQIDLNSAKIFDLRGGLVNDRTIEGANVTFQTGLKSGMYIATFETSNGSAVSYKFIVK